MIRFGGTDHKITGSAEAEKILKEFGYEQDTIDRVKHCIETHRADKNTVRDTIEAEIITNADAMAHYDAFLI